MRSYKPDQTHGPANTFHCHLCNRADNETYWHWSEFLMICSTCKRLLDLMSKRDQDKHLMEIWARNRVAARLT